MLVLTRKVDESVVIAENIVITILSIEGDKVKLGIEAPREIPILRKELFDAIREQEQLASELAKSPSPQTIEALRRLLVELDALEDTPPSKPSDAAEEI
ncbi:MAG: carbon storage regulator CsrA [Thermanaerothrix sp.]|nr:carbon storage regulator CsrA [Thermanaerothrix sp.]